MSKLQERKAIQDGLISFQNGLANSRNAVSNNAFQSERLRHEQMREIYRTGLGNKVVRVKTQNLFKDSLLFANTEDEKYFKNRIKPFVQEAARWMMAFGRGVIVIHEPGADVSTPLPAEINLNTVKFKSFSGDLVTVSDVDLDLASSRYYKPKSYVVRGVTFHHSRVIDFTYVKPSEVDLPHYQYGGISEFELINEQLINDGIMQRSIPHIIEKNSTLFYKVKGFKDAMAMQQEASMVDYFTQVENNRSIYGAGILDEEDTVEAVSQAMANLSESDTITLRRIAMVTSIPVALLIGENVKGLNSTGEHEMSLFYSMIEAMQEDYFEAPIKSLFSKLGLGDVEFKDSQGETPEKRINFQATVIDNAFKLFQMGEDYSKYLATNGIKFEQDLDGFFSEGENAPEEVTTANPENSLNGAQVTALLNIVERLRAGEINKTTAVGLITLSFPVSTEQAESVLSSYE